MSYNRIVKSTLRLNLKTLPVIALAAAVMQIVDPSRAWVVLLVALGGAWLFSRWWVRGLAHSLRFERELRYGWAQVGDRLEERFTLTNRFPLPATWVAVHDHSTLPDCRASVATGVDGQSVSQWKILTQCTRRGVFMLGGATLETGDPLGIYTLTLEDSASSTLAVMPPVIPLPRFEILAGGWTGEGRTHPRTPEETLNASHTREMVPGDPLKWIHWKTTARRNAFHVRAMEGTHAGDWWILLDLYAGSQLGTGWNSTEEHGVILAASLIAQGLSEEHAVGLAVNGAEPAWHVPRRNEYQQRSLLKSLAVASPSGLSLKEYLHRAGEAFRHRGSLLIVTACANADWTPSLLPLMRRGILPTVFLLDINDYGGGADIGRTAAWIRSLGAACNVIARELFERPEARPGHEGEWEWRISATGRAHAVKKPAAEWKRLE